jgi:hypothetical protein
VDAGDPPVQALATQAINSGHAAGSHRGLLGHQKMETTPIYANPWELHQTGEKLQVAC